MLQYETKIYDDLVRMRISLNNRLRAYGKNKDWSNISSIVEHEKIITLKRIEIILKRVKPDVPIITWLDQIPGVGITTIGKLCAAVICIQDCSNGMHFTWVKDENDNNIKKREMCPYWKDCQGYRDIRRFPKPSHLRSYFGLTPDKTKRQRNVSIECNATIQAFLIKVVGENFIKQQNKYATKIFYSAKARSKKVHPEWNDPKKHPKRYYKHAIRVMLSRFIIEFWKHWYMSLGIPVPTKPYVIDVLNHKQLPDIYP